jgi:nicotinamide-nucleotide amidase
MASDSQLLQLAEQVGRRLLAAGKCLAAAESCTGGWLAKTVTDLPGSSQWFERGYVTYSNAAKVHDLQVAKRTLEEHGAVSEATAREMAAGALQASGADVAIAITGIAGPDGGSADKPVGTVWFASAVRHGASGVKLDARVQYFNGDRDTVRRDSVKYALEWLVAIQFPSATTTV